MDEVILPGLGVFFEILWNNADANLKQMITETIKEGLQMKLTPNSSQE
jgi:small acid-soluble spore protein I